MSKQYIDNIYIYSISIISTQYLDHRISLMLPMVKRRM